MDVTSAASFIWVSTLLQIVLVSSAYNKYESTWLHVCTQPKYSHFLIRASLKPLSSRTFCLHFPSARRHLKLLSTTSRYFVSVKIYLKRKKCNKIKKRFVKPLPYRTASCTYVVDHSRTPGELSPSRSRILEADQKMYTPWNILNIKTKARMIGCYSWILRKNEDSLLVPFLSNIVDLILPCPLFELLS